MAVVIFVLVLWYVGLFFQSFFLHRYAAHQVFTMSKTIERIAIDKRFTKNVPQWKAFDTFASSRFSRVLWISLYILFFAYFTTAAWQWLLLPITFLMAPIHGVIINWFGHIYGYVNFQMKNTSKNLFRFDFLMMGEGYHNNHHKHASSANFGVKWYEVDVTYVIIKLLDAFGFIQLKPIPVQD